MCKFTAAIENPFPSKIKTTTRLGFELRYITYSCTNMKKIPNQNFAYNLT